MTNDEYFPSIERQKTVCFSGHRLHKFSVFDDVVTIQDLLHKTILDFVQAGYTTFLSGMADGFDMLAAESVLKMQKIHPYIKLIGVIPCNNWRQLRGDEEAIFAKAHKIIAIASKAGTKAYHARNRYLVDNASVLVCYFNGSTGGTRYTVNYATTQQVKIINLCHDFCIKCTK